jgi:hypothetical protein
MSLHEKLIIDSRQAFWYSNYEDYLYLMEEIKWLTQTR